MSVIEKFAIILIILRITHANSDYNDEWHFHEWLDSHQNYLLRWRTDDESETITFKTEVRTRGWIGFGISQNGGMRNSDIVIGWITDDGNTHFHVKSCHLFVFRFNFSFFRIAMRVENHFPISMKVKTGNYWNLLKMKHTLY